MKVSKWHINSFTKLPIVGSKPMIAVIFSFSVDSILSPSARLFFILTYSALLLRSAMAFSILVSMFSPTDVNLFLVFAI